MYQIYPRENPEEFEFTTAAGVIYACYFLSARSIFRDYPDVAESMYTFDLIVEAGNNRIQATDERIGMTVTLSSKNFC